MSGEGEETGGPKDINRWSGKGHSPDFGCALRYEHSFTTACIPLTRILNTGSRYITESMVDVLWGVGCDF